MCIVADRGFGDQKLYLVLTEELKFDVVIRFRGNITGTRAAGETRTTAAFVGPRGRIRVLRGALVTAASTESAGASLRDRKDPRLRLGMGSIHGSTPERRDRLWLLNAFAIALLTLLGAAGEALDYDRYLKSNIAKRPTHSLFRQGRMLYEFIPTMPELRLLPLIERFATTFVELPLFAAIFGAI